MSCVPLIRFSPDRDHAHESVFCCDSSVLYLTLLVNFSLAGCETLKETFTLSLRRPLPSTLCMSLLSRARSIDRRDVSLPFEANTMVSINSFPRLCHSIRAADSPFFLLSTLRTKLARQTSAATRSPTESQLVLRSLVHSALASQLIRCSVSASFGLRPTFFPGTPPSRSTTI